MTAGAPALVCLGNFLVDDVVHPDGRTRMGEAGGAMLYAALGARLWNVHVGIVAPVGTDYPKATLTALEARGIDLRGVRPIVAPGLRAWLLYESTRRRIVHHLAAATHDVASPTPEDVPDAYRGARIFHLSPMPLARQALLAAALATRDGAEVTLDPHEPVREDNLVHWREVLAHVSTFFPCDEELRLARAEEDPAGVVARLAGGRLRAVLLKRGARGGVHVDAHTGADTAWQARATEVVDPTGAGDAFAGGFLAGRIEGEDLRTSLEQGVVSASFAIEAWGADGLLRATPAAARLRQQDWFAMRAGA